MKENTKKALIVWGIIALLIILIRVAGAQTARAPDGQCFFAEVAWNRDSLRVRSWGCIDTDGDTLLILNHFVNDRPREVMRVLRKDVVRVTTLVLKDTLTIKRNGDP